MLKEGPWTFLFQPKKGTLEWDSDEIALIITHSNHKVFTQEFFETVFEPVAKQMDEDFRHDFAKIAQRTQGRWLSPLKDTSLYEVLSITKWNLSDDKKRIRSL